MKNVQYKNMGMGKKKRTMLRFVKAGDIFCFQYSERKYCFGRIMCRIITGHVAEIFDFMSETPEIKENNIEESSRLMEVLILDTYGLFDRKSEGEWRIIGHQENYVLRDVENLYFSFGVKKDCKKIDVFGNEWSISEEEKSKYSKLMSIGDFNIKQFVAAKLDEI